MAVTASQAELRQAAGRWGVVGWEYVLPLGKMPLAAGSEQTLSGEAAAVQEVAMRPGSGFWQWVGSSQQEEAGFWRQPSRRGPALALVEGSRRWGLG